MGESQVIESVTLQTPPYPATGHLKGGVKLHTGRLTLLPDIAINSSVAPTQSFQSKPETFCSSHDIEVGKRRKAVTPYIIYPIIYGNTNRSTSATRATSKM